MHIVYDDMDTSSYEMPPETALDSGPLPHRGGHPSIHLSIQISVPGLCEDGCRWTSDLHKKPRNGELEFTLFRPRVYRAQGGYLRTSGDGISSMGDLFKRVRDCSIPLRKGMKVEAFDWIHL